MKILNEQNINDILLENRVSSDIENGFLEDFSIQNKWGNYNIHSKKIGNYMLMKQKSLFYNDTIIKGEMDTPSVRLYFIHKSRNGIKVKIDRFNSLVSVGMLNIALINDRCSGEDIFLANDQVEVSCILISEKELKNLTENYPEIFENIYQQFSKNINTVLSGSFNLSVQIQSLEIIKQLENAHLMGNSQDVYSNLKVLELLILQLAHLNKKNTPKKLSSSEIERIHQAKFLITQDINSPLQMSDISREIGINEKKLQKGFKEIFGTTVFNYLYEYKMELAKQYLLDTDKTVSEIAFLCGYDYLSHFSTAFKRKYGISPLEMRRY